MSKKKESINEFIIQCKTLLPEFNTTRNPSNRAKINNQEINEYISFFLEESIKFTSNLNSNQIDKNFVNFFLSKLLLQRYPNYSQEKMFSIQSLIKNFLNFLTLKKVLKYDITKKISSDLQDEPIFNKKIEEKITSQKNQLINILGKEIINFSLNLDEKNLDNNFIDSFLKEIESYPEKIIVKTIFKLFEEIKDDNVFFKILYIIDSYLKLNTLPSKTVEYLRFKAKKERTIFRLLILYQSFYYAGYKLEKSMEDVFNDLNIDNSAIDKFFEGSLSYLNFPNDLDSQQNDDLFNIDKIINKIKPLDDDSPIFEKNETLGFNLPKNIDLKIDKYANLLEDIYNSSEMNKEFLIPFSKEFSINNLIDDKMIIFFEAKEFAIKGKNNKALMLINKFLKKNPNFVPALMFKGEILCELHQIHYALKCFLKCLEINSYMSQVYSNLSYTLQIGGYFHGSFIVCSHLLKFFPLDFNLHVQLAFSAYQLSKPFKPYLKIAGMLEPLRLINFVDRFWITERIEARDSLESLNVNNETISNIENVLTHNSNILLQSLFYFENIIQNDDTPEDFDDLINDPLYFFPEKIQHTKKNHFIYELATGIAMYLIDWIENKEFLIERYFLTSEFLQFCLKISNEISNRILEKNLKYVKAKKTISLDLVISKNWIQDSLNNSIKEPYFNLIKFLMPLREFYEIIQGTINDLAGDCLECPAKCLIYASEIFPNFEKSCDDWEDYNKKKMEREMQSYRVKFEKDFLPILSSFEDFLTEKALSKKTIEEKLSASLEFCKFISFNLNMDLINFKNNFNEELLPLFIEKHLLDNKLVRSKTEMERVKRSLNSFLAYLSKELGYFSGNRLKSLKEMIKIIELPF